MTYKATTPVQSRMGAATNMDDDDHTPVPKAQVKLTGDSCENVHFYSVAQLWGSMPHFYSFDCVPYVGTVASAQVDKPSQVLDADDEGNLDKFSIVSLHGLAHATCALP
jgi:hypothetical protein